MCAATALPRAGRTQQSGQVRRVGLLSPTDENNANLSRYTALFAQGLEELGWVNGRNLRIDIRWAGGNVDRMRTLARELSDLGPDAGIHKNDRNYARLLLHRSRCRGGADDNHDPVASGILTNIARPEGNTTGVTDLFPSIGGKWLELFKEAIPRLARVALIFNPDFLTGSMLAHMEAIEAAAARYSVKAMRIVVRSRIQMIENANTKCRPPSKASPGRTAAPGAPISCRHSIRCYRSNHVR
jgi:putative tryptophan/tyrosine transport system substrate-binding protein